jgi:hypothetical protein
MVMRCRGKKGTSTGFIHFSHPKRGTCLLPELVETLELMEHSEQD